MMDGVIEEESDAMSKPLAGIRVIDMALLLPGALTATWLADLGATVTRIEPAWGHVGVIGWSKNGPDPYFAVMRSEKEVLRLNLRRAADRQRLLALVTEADVLIEGFRPGTLDRRGFGYEALREENPRLIYCSISGFGKESPRWDRPSHDINYLALAGILDRNRSASGAPHPLPIQLADVGGGTYPALVSILAALFVRERTGYGQHLEVALFDGTLAWNYFAVPASRLSDLDEQGLGLGLLTGGALCYNVYECADGSYLALGALEPYFWQNVCELLARPDLIPYAANPEPGADERLAQFRALFRSRTREEWLELLNQKETLATPLVTLDEVLEDEYIHARGLLVKADGFPRIRFPVRVGSGEPVDLEGRKSE